MLDEQFDRAWTALRRGDAATSVRLFGEIVDRLPASAEAHAGLGHALLRLADDGRAAVHLERARSLAPGLPEPWRDLGLAAMRRSDYAVAEACVRRAVELAPGDANAWFLLGQALFALDRHDESEQAFSRAAALHPSFIPARFTLGNMAFDHKAFAAASRHYRAFVSARPTDLNGWINLGLSLAESGDNAAARTAFERAVAIAPKQVKPAALLAAVLRRAQAPADEFAPVLVRVLELAPDAVDMRIQLACCRFDQGDYADAHAQLRRALALDPDNATARWLQMQMPAAIVAADEGERQAYLQRWLEGIARFEAIDWSDARFAAQAADTLTSATNFYLAYLGRPLLDEQVRNAAVLRRMAQCAFPQHADLAPRRIGERRRRIAVFSSSLNAHAVSRVLSGALLALDPAQFELHAFYPNTVEDESTRRWRSRAAAFESGRRPAAAWIDALRSCAPDIVVFPDVGLDRLVQAIASLRHAPVQIAAWGHPVTTGMATIDWFLSADACEPEDADRHYSERLLRLPGIGAYLDPPGAGADEAPDPGGAPRLLCTQSADKLHPGHDALFADILAAAPQARLDVLCSNPAEPIAATLSARMRPAFAGRGIDFERRVRVHPRLPADRYYRFVAQADVCLDSLDFSGCVTTLDALWRDRPVVTLPGSLMRGRQTCGMLRLLGMDELVAADRDDYVRIAAGLAREPERRREQAAKIRERKRRLYRDGSVVTALAAFLRSVEASEGSAAPPAPA